MKLGLLSSIALASFLSACVADDGYYAYSPPQQQSCYRHDPLEYAPILTRITVKANYELKDPGNFYGVENRVFLQELDLINPGKYKLADGVTPNLILDITISNNGQDYYGAYLEGHGNGEGFLFSYTWEQIYATSQKLREDIVDQINAFITQGWHRGNC